MRNLLKQLCLIDGPSGSEKPVTDFIMKELEGYAELKRDSMGNVIAFKKGKQRAKRRLMIDAHADEVGMIITFITSDGFLKFSTLGGILPSVLLGRKVKIEGKVNGVIGVKPVHLCSAEEKETLPKAKDLYIDIGADSREEAESMVNIGDSATFISDFCEFGENVVKAKAIDDRGGCAVLLSLLKKDSEYDYYATFSVQEENGCRGARVAAYTVNPEFSICLESTTAADISGVSDDKKVCILGKGPAISFMDNSTLYDKELYNAAINSGLTCQSKTAIAGGNNSGSIHLSREGVRPMVISIPCRYIHSSSCACDIRDAEASIELCQYMINKICSGEMG